MNVGKCMGLIGMGKDYGVVRLDKGNKVIISEYVGMGK